MLVNVLNTPLVFYYIFKRRLLYKLNLTIFRPDTTVTFPSVTFECLITEFLYLCEFCILNISKFSSNLFTSVLVGSGHKTGFEPRFENVYISRVRLKSDVVFIQQLMVFQLKKAWPE